MPDNGQSLVFFHDLDGFFISLIGNISIIQRDHFDAFAVNTPFRINLVKEKLHTMIKGFLGSLQAVIERGQHEGRIRTDMEAERIAIMFLGLFQPAAFLYHLSDGRFDIVKQVDTTWKMFSKAIQQPTTPPKP